MLFEALIPITLFICSFAAGVIITYINRTAKHKERMALIENGLDAGIFDVKSNKKNKKTNFSSSLKWGMVSVAIGMGLLVGGVLDAILGWEEVAYFSMILLFGGAALIGYYLIMEKKEKEEKEEQDKKDTLV